MAQALQYAQQLGFASDMSAIWADVFQRPANGAQDVDEDLYNGFIGNNDRRTLTRLRGLPPDSLMQARPNFDDPRLEELLFRYRARNFPELLSAADARRWRGHCAARLFDGAGNARTLEQLFNAIDELAETADDKDEEILAALYDYAESIAPEHQD
nr:hypothetical protein [Sulfuriferula sp. AH1]